MFLTAVNQSVRNAYALSDPGEGGGGDSYTLPIGVCAARRGHDFGAPDLERAIQFYDGASVSDPVAH